MTIKKNTLKDLAHSLDNASGGVNLATITMDDISANLLHVAEDMDNVKEGTDLRIYFREWHREIRILAKLMYHTSEELNKSNEEVSEISEQIFDQVVREK